MAEKKKTTSEARKEKLPKGTKVFSTKESAEKAYKEQVKRVQKTKKIKFTNVYNANFSEIDECLDEIKKECRKHGVNDYACNNIQIILDDTLKRVKLSEH
jgi:2-phosphoglycerate kinase|tara:strand:+ start:8677 stop:8976 length:300 start_codon:yes stop_codon:yes gene_type:complete